MYLLTLAGSIVAALPLVPVWLVALPALVQLYVQVTTFPLLASFFENLKVRSHIEPCLSGPSSKEVKQVQNDSLTSVWLSHL